MPSMLADISIDAGNFSSKNGARLSLSIDALAKRKIESKIVFYDTNTGGIREHATVDWRVVSITSVRRGGTLLTFVLGEDGQVIVIEKERVWEHPIVRDAAAAARGPLRKIRAIGSDVVAVGMDRQVYVYGANNDWLDITPPGPVTELATGFEALAGPSVADLYCAGWRGEIWRRQGTEWRQVDSPTNILINDLFWTPDVVYGCGLGGLVIRGDSNDVWEILDQGAFDLDLYSVAEFAGKIYLASIYGNYRLENEKIFDIDYGITPPTTGHTLCALPDALGAIGAKDLLLFDGSKWKRLE